MTGFGAADGEVAGGRLRLEIRSVNHRHLSVQLKVPSELSDAEGAIRERLRSHFDRGHVTVSGRWVEEPSAADAVTVDVERARALVGALRKLGRDLKLTGKVDLADGGAAPRGRARLESGGVAGRFRRAGPARPRGRLVRGDAGAGRGGAVRGPRWRGSTRWRRWRGRSRRRRPSGWCGSGTAWRRRCGSWPAGSRWTRRGSSQEIAYLADRLDITEELVRFESHLAAMREALAGSDAAGRRLSFLLQEMGREANTIGSKANDAAIAAAVITMKTELEKLREQVENLE